MATILRPSWLAYRVTKSFRLAPRPHVLPVRQCSSDSEDQKGADKLASLLTSLKKKQPLGKEGSPQPEEKGEGVKLAQPKAQRPIKRTKGGLPKPEEKGEGVKLAQPKAQR